MMNLTTKIQLDFSKNGADLEWFATPNEIDNELFVDVSDKDGTPVFFCSVKELENLARALRIANQAENDALDLDASASDESENTKKE